MRISRPFYGFYSMALLCLSPLTSAAVDTQSSYMILGPGAYPCERIISDLAEDAKRNNPASVIVYSNWLAGDLTAYNRDAKKTYSILGDESFTDAFAWAVQYCQDNPKAIYAAAADALILKLKPQRLTSMPHPEEEDNDDNDAGPDAEGSKESK